MAVDKLTDSNMKFLYLLAHMYMMQSKYDSALYLYKFLRERDTSNMKIVLALVYCFYKAKKPSKAMEVLQSFDANMLSLQQKTVYFFICSKVLWDLEQKDQSREMLNFYLKCRQLKK